MAQILQLEQVGCELVRMAIIDEADAAAITEIRKRTHIPLVADIHYDYRLAIAAVKAGIDKIRLNPGNIGSKENVKAVVAVCNEYIYRFASALTAVLWKRTFMKSMADLPLRA